MRFHFSPIFSDCLNFINNKRLFFFQWSFIFAIENLVFNHLFTNSLPKNIQELSTSLNIENISLSENIFPLIIGHLFLNMMLFMASILSIHQITIKNQSFKIVMCRLFQRLGGELLLVGIVLFPLFASIIELLFFTMGKGGFNIIVLASLSIAIFVFVRLNLTFIHYLVSNDTLKQSILTIWQKGFKRMSILTMYSVIVYILFNMLINQLTFLMSNNVIFDFALIWLGSGISLFGFIFSYRFYTKFIQLS